jgi:predicted phosphodiesterase
MNLKFTNKPLLEKKSFFKGNFMRLLVIAPLMMLLIPASCQKINDQKPAAETMTFSEILGRPTLYSVTVSILSGKQAEVYWELGTTSGKYTNKSQTYSLLENVPLEAELTGLLPDSRYFYRTRYRTIGGGAAFNAGVEHSFQTGRTRGKAFTFAIEADPHLDANSDTAAYYLTLGNMAAEKPDFLVDLGDTFFSEKQPVVNQDVITARHLLFRPYFGKVCHSSPLYLVLGNHEGESGWLQNGTDQSVAVLTSNTRKLYYPNPFPNTFYSGNSRSENFVGLREDYYSWQWGDALFVVLDPYWYTATRPVTGWEWTLGIDQYNWFKNVLSASTAKYKFVFCHNLVGGYTKDARGGAEYAHLFEMGGNNADGTWGFDINRPGWGKPIHTLMKENNVTVFFHGHDHFYGKQEKDGIIYQEVPQPSNRNLTNISATQYGYVNGVFLPGRGYLRVTVSPGSVKVDYVKTYLPSEESAGNVNREIAASYSVIK